MPEVPWEKLGYRPAPSAEVYWRRHAPFIIDGPPRAVFVLIYLGFLHLGFFAVGVVRWARNRRAAVGPPPRGEGQKLPAAVGVAVGLLGLTWLYAQALRSLLGPTSGLADYARVLPSVGWLMPLQHQQVMMTVQPPWIQLVAGVVVALGAPLAQEVFFRGGLLGMWSAAGRFRAGAVLTAAVAAALVRDWAAFPVTLAGGLAMAWLYGWSRTLLAHVLLNAGLLCLVYGLIPSLPEPVDQLCGQWAGAVHPDEAARVRRLNEASAGLFVRAGRPPDVEFLRGGMVKGGRRQTITGRGSMTLEPRWYAWADREHIDVRWERTEQEGRQVTVTLEVVRYRVAVGWDELTLTRDADGQVSYYRRGP